MFALDASGSIGKDNFEKILDFLTSVVVRLDLDQANSQTQGMRLGLLTYATSTSPQFNLGDYTSRTAIMNALRVRYTGGTTNTADAIK